MAMNKKERQELEDAKRQLETALALRWSEKADGPDLRIPEHSYGAEGLVKGFLFCESGDNPRVEPACSDSAHHSFGRDDRTTTQGARHLFSTRMLALRALRNAVEVRCAKLLAEVDWKIAAEKQK